MCRLRSRPSCQYSSIEVSVVCEHSMMTVRSDQWRGSSKLSTSARVFDQLLEPGRGRVLLLAVLVVGDQEREQVVSDAPVDGLDARHRIRPDAGGDRHRPRREADLLRIALPLSVRPRDREQLFGVRPRSLPELAREAGQAALVLHVQQELRRAVRVGGDDHLLGGVGVMVEMRGSLRPTGMTRVHLEPASVERDEVVHLVQLVDLGAELLRQVEVVRRQLVLGVVAAADVALAARDAAGAPRSDPAEVRIVGLDARAPEVDTDRGLVERLPSAHLGRDLLHDAIDVGGHVRVANDAEHPRRLVEMRRQLVGPVGDARPLRRVEELLRRDVQRVGVDVRPAADARAGEDEHVVEVLDPLDPVQLCRGEPQEVRQIPLASSGCPRPSSACRTP